MKRGDIKCSKKNIIKKFYDFSCLWKNNLQIPKTIKLSDKKNIGNIKEL